LFCDQRKLAAGYGASSSAALRESLLDLRTSRVRRQSTRPGNFKMTAWLPAESFSVAGALPWNFSSMKISAPSGSEVMVTTPKPSGEDGFCGSGADSVARDAVLCGEGESAASAASLAALPRARG